MVLCAIHKKVELSLFISKSSLEIIHESCSYGWRLFIDLHNKKTHLLKSLLSMGEMIYPDSRADTYQILLWRFLLNVINMRLLVMCLIARISELIIKRQWGFTYADIVQMVERLICNQNVEGSIPSISSISTYCFHIPSEV